LVFWAEKAEEGGEKTTLFAHMILNEAGRRDFASPVYMAIITSAVVPDK
jgi:hypothetical protein